MVKNWLASAGDTGLIPGLGRSPGEGNGNPLQHLCLENSIDRGAWRTTVYGVAKSWTRLSTHTHIHTHTLTGALAKTEHGVFWCFCLFK